jgi:DNA-binding IclR family transcriptional regulator
MMEIAREVGMNASTCYNILKTMQAARLLGYNPDTKRYELGLTIVELSTLVNGGGQILRVALEHIRRMTKEIGLTCLVARMQENQGFVVVGKSEGRSQQVRVTVSIGQQFQPNASVMAKAYYAWTPEAAFDEMVAEHSLPARSPYSITDVDSFKRDVGNVRLRGYSTSIGEYYPEHNAVGTALIDPAGAVSYVLVVTGFASQITPRTLPLIGRHLNATARAITHEVGGSYPTDWKGLTGWLQL